MLLVGLKGCVGQIEQAIDVWREATPHFPDRENVNVTGISAQAILDSLIDLRSRLFAASNQSDNDPILSITVIAQIQSHCQAIISQTVAHGGNYSGVYSTAAGIIQSIYHIRKALSEIEFIKFDVDEFTEDMAKQLQLRVRSIETSFNEIGSLHSEINTISGEAHLGLRQISEAVLSVQQTRALATEASETVKSLEREAATAKTNAEASATLAGADASRMKGYTDELGKAVDEKRRLFSEFEQKRAQIEALLQGANRTGLAVSFQLRRKRLNGDLWIAQVVFYLSLALIAVGQVLLARQSDWSFDESLPKMAFRGLLAFPFVWIAWFSVRQIGMFSKLQEDYAFKEAAAMAYVGYRDQMGDDEEMLKLLQERAIEAFGDNPTRLFGKQDTGSPIHDLLEKVMEKVSPKELLDFFTELVKAKK